MARWSTLHKRRRRQRRTDFELYKMYLYLIAMDEVVAKHTWEIDKVEDTNIAKLYYVNDDWPRGLCRVRIKTTYKDNRGRFFYCVFALTIEMVEQAAAPSVWQKPLLARVPYMLVNFLIKHPTKVKELKPIVKGWYGKPKRRR